MRVAWLGLGQMGLPSAQKVVAAGHEVRGYDLRPPQPGQEGGITVVASPREAIVGAELICLAVFNDAQVEELLVGPDGWLADLPAGTVVAIFTTGSIEAVQALAAAAPTGVTVLDTCFSRMYAEMASGMLTLLVGGDAAAIDQARPALDAFSREIIHVGASGSGRAIKLVNNFVFAAHLQVAADGLRFAKGLGLDPLKTAQAILRCSGSSDIFARAADGDITQMLETSHHYMVKDVSAAADAARTHGVELDVLNAVERHYRP